ncbi:MAG: OmpA family protein [Saprospiraceae bacterium]
MKKYIFSTLLFSFFALTLVAQPINRATFSTMMDIAKEAEEADDYYNAVEWYEKAYEDSETVELARKLADLNMILRDYRRAERFYRTVVRKDKKMEDIEVRYYYGRVLKMNGKYPNAIENLQAFIDNTDNEKLKELAQAELTGAEMAQDMDEVNGLEVEHAGRDVNSNFSEYSPAFAEASNTLYYASFDTKEVIVLDGNEGDWHAKIYTAAKEEKGFGKPAALDQVINREGFHTSNPSFSKDGSRMYFTRSKLEGNEVVESRIYESAGGHGNWGGAIELAGVNGDFVAKHPSTGELFGKEVLFFVSNMEGGYGGYDVYYATSKGDGVYGDPVNLGPKINTLGDEETPFYRDGNLYFSSTGHPGLGGYDLFISEWNGALWSEPVNMGKGYNSSVDDRSYTIDSEGYTGYLTSNRDGTRSVKSKTCCDDIFQFSMAKVTANLVVGTFTADKKPLLNAETQLVTLFNDTPGDTQSKNSGNKSNVTQFNLGLETPYMVIATAEGYFPDTAYFNTVGVTETKSFEQRLYLDKMPPPPPPEPEFEIITTEQAIALENILYDFNDDRIKEAAERDLQVVYELMQEYPDMIIELGSHTDARGNDNYNADLSQRRADSARRWLVRKGIPRARIQTNGYGESQPRTVIDKQTYANPFLNVGDVLTEAYIDALSDEDQQEAAHQLNRRTEFKIIEGPTTIKIKTERLKKVETQRAGSNRNSNIAPVQDTIVIHEYSSMYGRKDFTKVPVMKFDERHINLGMVKKGEKRTHTYTFTNIGGAPLTIDIISACNCTTVEWTEGEIKPGEGGKIDIVFDSTEKDYAETIDLDIILLEVEPETDMPIIERVVYEFDIEK